MLAVFATLSALRDGTQRVLQQVNKLIAACKTRFAALHLDRSSNPARLKQRRASRLFAYFDGHAFRFLIACTQSGSGGRALDPRRGLVTAA